VDFPEWNRRRPVWLVRRLSQAMWILPLARVFARARIEGLEHVKDLKGPVVFASNHQSHFDVPVILAALPGRVRARVAPAMAKEFFKAHFFPEGQSWRARLSNSLNYYLAAFFFNAFPLPQREAGARQTLKYIGELTGMGWSILIFPEGMRSPTGQLKPFRGGIGMIGSRLDIPIVPIRIDDVDKLMPMGSTFVKPGRVRVTFGAPSVRLPDEALFERLVKTLFSHRRKTLSNAIKPFDPTAPAVLALSGIDGQRRPETLQVTEIARLAELFASVRRPAVL
jgi:long-chain acyl-CoA synthetase